MKNVQGFSLIELLVAVAIIAILTSIALPSYRDYVTRSKIIEATKNLSDGRVRMEQFFQDNRTYVGGLGCVADNDAITVFSDAQNFTYKCTTVNATAFTLEATGVQLKGMDGFVYTINQSNAKSSTISAPATSNGWVSNNTCWTTNKGGKC